MFFYNIPGENHDVIHDFDANLVDDSSNLKKKCGIVYGKEKQTINVSSENAAARVDIRKSNALANEHFRPC